jgi:hypothetical protein
MSVKVCSDGVHIHYSSDYIIIIFLLSFSFKIGNCLIFTNEEKHIKCNYMISGKTDIWQLWYVLKLSYLLSTESIQEHYQSSNT